MTDQNGNGSRYPAVSVIMPAYNAEGYIEIAIRSVMEQTCPDWELIVIDDCSRDNTPAVVERLAQKDSRITLVRNEANMGVAATRNRGFSLAMGSYAALLDCDDRWYPGKLERQLALAGETGADIIYCSYAIVDENGRKRCDDFLVPKATDFDASLTQSVISCSTALLSRKVIENYRFDSSYYHEDLALWLQLLKDGFAARGVPEVLAEYRVMDGTRASNKLRSAAYRWQIYRRQLGFSMFRSAKLLARYALLGLRKYKAKTDNTEG